jgi:hypothetical protein
LCNPLEINFILDNSCHNISFTEPIKNWARWCFSGKRRVWFWYAKGLFWSQVKLAMSSRIRWQLNHRWHCVKGTTRGVLVFYPECDPSCDTNSFSTWLRQLNYHFPLTDWQLDCSKMYSDCRQVCSLHTKLTGVVTGVEFNTWKQRMHFAIDQLNCWHSSAIWSTYKNIYMKKILKIHWTFSLLKIDTLNFLCAVQVMIEHRHFVG